MPIDPSITNSAAREERFRLLMDTIPHMVWIADARGVTNYLNRRTLDYLGVASSATHGWGWLSVLHPQDAEAARAKWERCVANGIAYRNEYRVLGADGNYCWFLSQGVPVRRENGDIERWIGTWTDIDDLQRAAEALRTTTDLLRAVSDTTPDAFFVKDLEGRYLLFNPAAARFVGLPVEAVLGRDDTALFGADGAARIRARDARVMQCGQIETDEEELTAAGVTRVYLATKAPYRDSEGAVIGTIGVSRDITERKKAERDLVLRDRAIQAVNQGIVISDARVPNDPIIYASLGFEKLTGYSVSEALGRNCNFLQGKDTDPAAVARLREAVRNERPHTEIILNFRKDGSPFWNEVSVSPVRDDAGRVTHFVGVQNDVTARRELESQLLQAQKLEAVGLLAGGVAHDFNNLLTIITGYSWMLLDLLPPDDKLRGPVEEIKKAGDRSAALTRQLLSFSRKQMLAPKALDLNAILSEMESMLRRLLGEDLRFEVEREPDLEPIFSDRGQIEQLLLNLAVNARDAMPRGGRLTITTANVVLDDAFLQTHSDVTAGPHVLLTVRDTGVGMAEDVRSRIFEPFFTTKPEGKGTGLGLSVVHGVVRQSRGCIEVESAPDAGTRFKIYFPVPAVPTARDTTSTPGDAAPKGVETLLLVEDEDAVRALARTALERLGYTLLAAADAEEALRLAQDHPGRIDLLVTDVVMPGMGGRQLAETLVARLPTLKVLFLSGYTNDDVVRRGVSHDQVDFLQKPFTPATLARAVRKTLDAQRPAGE